MNHRMNYRSGQKKLGWTVALTAVAVLILGPLAWVGHAKKQGAQDRRLAEYLQRVRQSAGASSPTLGGIWTPQSPLADMMTDYKAKHVHDLITIRIVEQTTAEGDATLEADRTFESNSAITALLGQPGATSGLRSLFSPRADNAVNGGAQTSSTMVLRTSLTGHVVEVLPNGVLVIEAAREVQMNNERQTVILRGVVRPGDVAPDNSVPSTLISNLEVELRGKGVITDSVRRPNRLTRILLRILGF